jgi:uncharacterized protein
VVLKIILINQIPICSMKKILTCLFVLSAMSISIAQNLFPPLDTNYRAREIRVSSTLKLDVLFEGNRDFVWDATTKQYAVSKTWHDFTGLVPLGTGNDSCLLIVNHEMRDGYFGIKSTVLGDGGGMTVFRVNKNPSTGRWGVAPYKGQNFWNVDFRPVRGTYTNCAGVTLPVSGQFMTSEEVTPSTNQVGTGGSGIGAVFSDTTDYTIPSGPYKGRTIKAFQNYGWMIAVDAPNAKALYKSYAMGRAAWEGGWASPDGKSVYLMTDNTPAALIRFVADTAFKYEFGQLQAYKQTTDGKGGSWFDIPRDWDSIYNVNTVAFRRGATMFSRLEWAVGKGDKIYMAETGNDNANYRAGVILGGVPSFHFQRADTLGGMAKDTFYNDYYGRVLELNTTTNALRPFVEGGIGSKFAFSNPDGLSIHEQDGKSYLVVVEDLNGTTQGRSGGNGLSICEAFFLDLSIANPTLNDLRPFISGAQAGELTGSVSTPDGKTVFINSQHPYTDATKGPISSNNNPPFNNDMTIAVTGFSLTSPTQELKITDDFSVYPNPAQDVINFNKATDVSLYNINGQQLRIVRNANSINVGDLNPGVYFLQTLKGAVVKVVKQ